jgi:sulfite exporter TauE/SafE
MLVPSKLADVDMGYGLLFAIGLFTSVHCVAMCGGINLSQCLPKGGDKTAAPAPGGDRFAILRPSVLYNMGRVISYTIVGFAAGALGSAVTFSLNAQGALKLVAGVFMIIMGINMLNLFPRLRALTPRMPKIITSRVNANVYKNKGPLIVGLLNGLMPCGPLQAVQIYALSTGNPIKGAIAMMVFSLGTVPLMFGLGTFSSAAGKKFSNKVMAAGAAMVSVLGLCMLTQGWNLFGVPSGMSFAAAPPDSGKALNIAIDLGPQVVNSTLSPYGYPNITVEAGRPVKWIINAPQGTINGCNYRFIIREYGIAYEFKTGENVVEFTPNRVGNIPYTCWMGMIPGTITVVSPGSGGAMGGQPSSSPPQKGPRCCEPKGG